MDEASVQAIARWRYEPLYNIYSLDGENEHELVQTFLNPAYHYYQVRDETGDLVAYCCFGPDARVPGGDYAAGALDVGLGVRPDLTGQGQGSAFVAAVLDFARRTFAPPVLRVTVAEFNRRAQRVWQKAGFRPVQTFERPPDSLTFVLLVRECRW
jgi:ribosomal-protein-alanine N-acetyltransferase